MIESSKSESVLSEAVKILFKKSENFTNFVNQFQVTNGAPKEEFDDEYIKMR